MTERIATALLLAFVVGGLVAPFTGCATRVLHDCEQLTPHIWHCDEE